MKGLAGFIVGFCDFFPFSTSFWSVSGNNPDTAHVLRPCVLFQIYYHGEPIKVHVSVTNNSSKNIKNIILSGKRDT